MTEKLTISCLYCDTEVSVSETSLEHAVPQFLGGAYAPLRFKLRNVCKACNNRLGLFVDASFAKSWFVTNAIAESARKLFHAETDQPIPLVCIGPVMIDGIEIPEGHICEYWLGPFGDSIFWIRWNDERLYWYSGGNPIDKKKEPSTAYLFLAQGNPLRLRISISSFFDAFKPKTIRTILGADVDGGDSTQLGFDKASAQESINILAFHKAINDGNLIKASLPLNVKFDERFIGKLALAFGYSLFGEDYLATDIAQEARKACWMKPGEVPSLRGASTFQHDSNPLLNSIIGYPSAVSLIVMPLGDVYVLSVSVNQSKPFVVELGPKELKSESIGEYGYVLLIFPYLRKSIELTLAELLAHISGGIQNQQLQEIDERLKFSESFYRVAAI